MLVFVLGPFLEIAVQFHCHSHHVFSLALHSYHSGVVGKGYGVFKPAVGEAVVDVLTPIREEAKRLIADKAYLNSVYREGAEKASYIANKTLRKVYKKIGFYQIDKK